MKEQDFQIQLIRYLSGELTAIETDHLLESLQSSAERQKFFEEYQQVWERTGLLPEIPSTSVDQQWEKFESAAFANSGRSTTVPLWGNPLLKIAAVIAVVATSIVAWSILGTVTGTKEDFVVMQTDSKMKEFQLPDGSIVWLNQSSKLEFDRSFIPRTIHLDGEALFEVKSLDEDQPFTVVTGDTKTTVLGTIFMVSSTSGGEVVTVYVQEGRVAFESESGSESQILTAGFQGLYDQEAQSITRSEQIDQNILSWKTGIFRFNDTPLAEILPLIERYYGVHFEIVNTGLLSCTYNSDFANMNLDEMLEELSFALNLHIDKNDSGIYEVDGTPCR